MKTIKDFIYFDYDKAKSLQSQLSGGLLQEITTAIENENMFRNETVWFNDVLREHGTNQSKSGVIYLNQPTTADEAFKVSKLIKQIEGYLTQTNTSEDDKANKTRGREIENRLDVVNLFRVIEAINFYTENTRKKQFEED